MASLTIAVLFAVLISLVSSNNEANEEINNRINRIQKSWQAGNNEITDKGDDYLMTLLGSEIPNNVNNLPVRNDIKILDRIPDTFDAREQWRQCDSISSIKNQGPCGSCWAVSTAAVASDRLCINSHAKVRLNVSAEHLLTCCKSCVQRGKKGCEGGNPLKAWEYFQHTGLVTGGDYQSNEGCQPYQIPPTGSEIVPTPNCHNSCINRRYRVPFGKDKHFGKTSFVLPQDVAAIQSEIMTNGPVVAAFIVYSDFPRYKGGVYHLTPEGEPRGGHGVRVIGWGNENGEDYWLVANSWGRRWGVDGSFKIRRGTNECQFESYMTAGLVRK